MEIHSLQISMSNIGALKKAVQMLRRRPQSPPRQGTKRARHVPKVSPPIALGEEALPYPLFNAPFHIMEKHDGERFAPTSLFTAVMGRHHPSRVFGSIPFGAVDKNHVKASGID